MKELQQKFLKFYNTAIQVTYNITIIILIIVLAVILFRIFQDLSSLMIERTARLGIKDLVISVLSLIVVLELMRAFVEYFEHHRVRMEILLEVLIAFGIREFMILIFQGKLDGVDVLYWTAGLFMLVLGRTLTIIVKPGGGKIPLRKKAFKPFRRKVKDVSEETG